MKIIYKDKEPTITFIPRKYPQNAENITLLLKNEVTNEILQLQVYDIIIDELMTISFEKILNVKLQDKFEITVKNNDEIIYLGKLLYLKDGTDIQNYEYNTQNNEYFRFKD